VQSVLAYADAQRDYYTRNPDNAKLLHYAQRMASSPGKRDGLYFPVKAGERGEPAGPLFDAAKAQGYPRPPTETRALPRLQVQDPHGAGADAKGGLTTTLPAAR
jgi:hypothetical protein